MRNGWWRITPGRSRPRPRLARLYLAAAGRRPAPGVAWRRQHLGQDRCRRPARRDAGEVLCVKGSGWDMAAIEPAGPPGGAARRRCAGCAAATALSDEDMVRVQRANLIDPGAPNPSVETLLHAFLPHKFIDHTHSTAVLSLADQPDAAERCADLYGGRLGIVPVHHAGLSAGQEGGRNLRGRPVGRRAGAAEARHLHLRRDGARGL